LMLWERKSVAMVRDGEEGREGMFEVEEWAEQ
jgi:hypothetical protein